MTYFFGFATTKHLYLAADRRRTGEGPDPQVDDSLTKIHRVGRSASLVGAGFMYFVDDLVGPQAESVFGTQRLNLQTVETSLPKLEDQLRQGHAQLAKQIGRSPAELHARFTLAGLDVANDPYSLGWTSSDGFQAPQRGPHAFSLPRAAPELAKLRPMIQELRDDAQRGASFKRITSGVAAVMDWVAHRDDTVSKNGDLVRFGGLRSRRSQFT